MFLNHQDANGKAVLSANAIFGINHGPNAIIRRLYDQHLISSPLLSIALFEQQMTIGSEDKDFCSHDWNYFPITNDVGWVFGGDVYFSTFGWINNTKVRFYS